MYAVCDKKKQNAYLCMYVCMYERNTHLYEYADQGCYHDGGRNENILILLVSLVRHITLWDMVGYVKKQNS